MTWREWLLLACAMLVVYTYFGYPVLLALLTRLRGKPHLRGPFSNSVSIVVSAFNEAAVIGRRATELRRLLDASGLKGEVIIISDGSTDNTASIVCGLANSGIRLIELEQNSGKAVALNTGCAQATGDVIVFADARQTWSDDTLIKLLENFADPAVGAASGALVVQDPDGAMAGVGLYWRYEKWLRRTESAYWAAPGVSGSICAVRKELYDPLPAGTILDDVHWPLRVALGGYRVVHDESARAYDRLPTRSRDEMRRKVRTLCGNFQLVMRMPALLLPVLNPIWWQFVSHKLCRLVVPWALLVLLIGSALFDGTHFRALFGLQLLFYLLGIIGLWQGERCRIRLASAASSFILLNTAAWLAFWVWITGRSNRSWHKVRYAAPAPPVAAVES